MLCPVLFLYLLPHTVSTDSATKFQRIYTGSNIILELLKKQQESESTKVKSTYVEDLLLNLKYKRFGVCPKCLPKKLSYMFEQILFDNTNSLFDRFDKEKELEGILNILRKLVRRFRSYSPTRCNDGYIISKDLIPANYKLK